ADLISFDPDARRSAQAKALRDDLVRHCGGIVPDPSVLFDKINPELRGKVQSLLRVVTVPDGSSEAAESTLLRLPLASLRKYLECPLQGAAQYAMGMFDEDDNYPGDHQDEPVSQSILERTMTLRAVFQQSRGDSRRMELEYDRSVRLAQSRGAAPVG